MRVLEIDAVVPSKAIGLASDPRLTRSMKDGPLGQPCPIYNRRSYANMTLVRFKVIIIYIKYEQHGPAGEPHHRVQRHPPHSPTTRFAGSPVWIGSRPCADSPFPSNFHQTPSCALLLSRYVHSCLGKRETEPTSMFSRLFIRAVLRDIELREVSRQESRDTRGINHSDPKIIGFGGE